jgi:hypothetical protein
MLTAASRICTPSGLPFCYGLPATTLTSRGDQQPTAKSPVSAFNRPVPAPIRSLPRNHR